LGAKQLFSSEKHASPLVGVERETITQPLFTGTIASTRQTVYFVITDASDEEFAEIFGAIRADNLAEVPDAAVDWAVFQDGEWIFNSDPGLVARFGNNGGVLPPVANVTYSPLKRIKWKGKVVTVNVNTVKWGDKPGQELIGYFD
jgi:hypothetical protein